jgi:hypothetical protein
MENSGVVESGAGQIPALPYSDPIDPSFLESTRVHELIRTYQRIPAAETWQAIVTACLPLIDDLIAKFQVHGDPDTLRSECILKLRKTIRYYDQQRGRAFPVLTVAFIRFLVQRIRAKQNGQAFSIQELLRLCFPSSLLPEIHGIVGDECFAKLVDVFAGQTVTFPSKITLAKIRKSREFLNGLEAFSSGQPRPPEPATIPVPAPNREHLEALSAREGYDSGAARLNGTIA